jgi:dCTP deaminase
LRKESFLEKSPAGRTSGKKKNGLRFDPPIAKEEFDQVSVDLRLGRKFTFFKNLPGHIAAVYVNSSLLEATMWEEVEQDEYTLLPNHLVLAQTFEKVTLPPGLVGFVEGRSTWGRVGVTVHVTAPKIDPGFSGRITLEMVNLGPFPIRLRAGIDKPCQLILFRTTSPIPARDLYGSKKTDLYQFQDSPLPSGR